MMRKMASALAGVLALASMSAARAQDGPPPSAERLRLAEQVALAAGGGESMKANLSRIMDAAAGQTGKLGTPSQQAQVADTQAFIKERLTFYLPQIMHAGAEAYAREFSEGELRDLLAFYQSPTGRAFQAKLPQVTIDTLRFAQPVLIRMQRDIIAHQCAATTCTDQQKANLAKLQAAAG